MDSDHNDDDKDDDVTGGSVFQEEARAGGDLSGVRERPGHRRHVQLGEVGHQGDRLEAGTAGDRSSVDGLVCESRLIM